MKIEQTRREFLKLVGSVVGSAEAFSILSETGLAVNTGQERKVPNVIERKSMMYQRANTDWLANCRYGIGVHWTAETMPRRGSPLPFQKAVDKFKIDSFLQRVVESGADYLIFTATHALHKLPAPNPVVDSVLRGRTCERDLIGEIVEGLSSQGIHLILYYNHSCNSQEDPEWERAIGYHDASKDRLVTNLLGIVKWMGSRYRDKLKGWWFDSCYSLDPRGPHNSVTTDMRGFQFPWEEFTQAAKVCYAQRLVTYNAGVNQTFLYTMHQDYWAGEMVNLDHPPTARYLDNGLQWHGWTCLDDRRWVHNQPDTEAPDPLYSEDEILEFVSSCNRHQAPMCFNVAIYQDGTISPKAVRQLKHLGERVKSG